VTMPADRRPDHRAGHSATTRAAGRPEPARADPVRAEVEQDHDARATALTVEQDPDGRATALAVGESSGGTVAATRPPAPQALQRLQAAAGNRAVTALVAQRHRPAPATRQAARPAKPATAAKPAASATSAPVQRLATGATDASTGRAGPDSDPKFAALKADVHGKKKLLSAHPSPSSEASKAHGAAKPPQDDRQAQGKTANAEKMNAAKPGEFDKAAFVKAVNDAIAQQAPKNLDEADKFGESGKADAVKGQVQGTVADGKKTSAAQIESTTKAPPDTAAATEKPVTPLQPDQPPATPGTPDPSQAIPGKAPASATDFSAGPKQVNDQMAQAEVTEDQLKKGNEPEFTGALAAKKDGEQHAATAPGVVRGKEAATLAGAKAHASQAGATAMTALATDRRNTGAAVAQGKDGAKSDDETKHAQVTAKLQTVFDATQKDVEGILTGLDTKVDDTFTAGEKAARDAFTTEHHTKMDAYKDKRYSGWTGKLRWVKDKFAGLPEEANQIFVTARQGYVTRMQGVISQVADVIGAELGRAKARIASGRDQLQATIKTLPADQQAIAKKAASDFSAKFDSLSEAVDAKGTELVNTLATKYTDALKSVDDEIAEEKEKNEGLVAKAVNAVKGVIDTILKLKDLLLGVLAKAASAVAAIIKDPIGFLGHLVDAVGAGLKNFIAHIGTHLQKGLIGWLMGNLASAGIQLPDKFDLRGILGMIAGLLGLTWASIRGRIVSRGVPDQAMTAVEQTVPIAQKIQSGGIGAIWEEIKDKIGDLKANLFGKISEYLIPTVLVAGITWIISLLNPASAFIKACKMIIDIVTFILDRGAQIIAFVNSILDAIIAIAGGGSGGVPGLIEDALAKSIPVLIGALAAILGVSGIADKVKSFIQSLSKPVMKAVDWVVDKIVGFGKKIWTKMKGFGSKIKGKLQDRFGRKKDGADGKDGKDGKGQAPPLTVPSKGFEDARAEQHELYFPKNDPRAPLMVHSTPKSIDAYLKEWSAQIEALEDATLKAQQQTAWKEADELAKAIKTATAALPDSGDARQKAHDTLVTDMNGLAGKLAARKSLTHPPLLPPVYPPFSNRVLAGSFTASYLNKDSRQQGEPSADNNGATLTGWDVVVAGGYNTSTSNSVEWVKMHLLPDKLGGKASDSNMVPARGWVNNPVFHWDIESPAAKALKKPASDPGHEDMVWYKVDVSYHSAHPGFPSAISAQWGGYEATGGQWQPKGATMTVSEAQDPPALPLNDVLRVNRAPGSIIQRLLGCTDAEAAEIKKSAKETRFADISDLLLRFPKLRTQILALDKDQRLKF
jgi:hypothetical protein